MRRNDRETVIKAAIYDGKIPAEEANKYRRMWDGNPSAIRNLLTASVEQGGLMPGLVGAGGTAATAALPDDAYEESWLTPQERAAVAANRAAPAPAAQAPAPAAPQAAAGGEAPAEYPEEWLSGEERNHIAAARASEPPPRVQLGGLPGGSGKPTD
jgi:hypothetical protein